MGAGEATILAQRIGQAAPRLDADHALLTVYRESDVLLVAHHALHPASRSKCEIRCGVIGISKMQTPNGASASETALSTAAGAPIVPPSPTPLAPALFSSPDRAASCRSGLRDSPTGPSPVRPAQSPVSPPCAAPQTRACRGRCAPQTPRSQGRAS